MTNAQEHMKAETLNQNLGHLWRVVPASEHTVGPAEAPVGDRTTTQRPPPTALGPVPVPRACVSKALRLIFRAACRPGLRAGPCASWGWYSAALRGSLQEVHSPAVARRAVAQTTPPPPHHACGR